MAVPVIICILSVLQTCSITFNFKSIKAFSQKTQQQMLNLESQCPARALEMFLKSLLTKTCLVTQSKLSGVVSVAHM